MNHLVKSDPAWWLERPSSKDKNPEENKPTFSESDVYEEYLKND